MLTIRLEHEKAIAAMQLQPFNVETPARVEVKS